MLKNNFKLMLRSLRKNVLNSSINILGLAVGLTSFILIALYIKYEISWDKNNKHYDRIYRIQQQVSLNNGMQIWQQTPYALSGILLNEYPEFETTTELRRIFGEMLSSNEDFEIYEQNGFYANSSLFKVFTCKFIEGDSATALNDPFSIVLTKDLADLLFPHQNPMGRTIRSGLNSTLKVTGVVENLPFNSHVRPSYLVSFKTLNNVVSADYESNMEMNAFYVYGLLKDKVSAADVNMKIRNELDQFNPDKNKKLYLKPLSEIYLTGDESSDSLLVLYFFGALATLILILSCLNSINITIAHGSLRLKEIAIRKITGSSRRSLVTQFLSESVFLMLSALLVAFMLSVIFLPIFNSVIDRNLSFNLQSNLLLFIYLGLFFVFIGILSGIYPALYLSSNSPSELLSGNSALFKHGGKKSIGRLRKLLVGFQFAITIIVVISTIYIYKQIDLIVNKDLGFNKENILICSVPNAGKNNDFSKLKNILLSNRDILNVSLSNNIPFHSGDGCLISGDETSGDQKIYARYNRIDDQFLNTYKIRLLEGRNFSEKYSTDDKACLVNQTLANTLGWKNPIGKYVKIGDSEYEVIGLVNDFHTDPPYVRIMPYVMLKHSELLSGKSAFSVKISSADVTGTVKYITNTLSDLYPETLCRVSFFDEDTRGLYDIFYSIENTFGYFSILAVIIAYVGLFGLVSFSVQRRIKEIGIRKILGSSLTGIMRLVARDYFVLLIVANIIAFPIVYLITSEIPVAYKYELQLWDFILPAIVSLVLSVFTTSYLTLKAAFSNPVDVIKYE